MPFVAAVETNDQGHPIRAVFAPVKSLSSAEIAAWACNWLAPAATVVSDGFACFRTVTAAGCTHAPQIVGTKRKSTDMDCFAWVNTLFILDELMMYVNEGSRVGECAPVSKFSIDKNWRVLFYAFF